MTLTLEEPDEMAQAAAELAVQSTIATNLGMEQSSVRILASSWTSAEGALASSYYSNKQVQETR